MTTDRAEPALGLALATGCGLRSISFRARHCAIRCRLRSGAVLSSGGRLGASRGIRLALLMSDGSSRTELNHVDSAFPASDQVSAWEQHNLTRGRQAPETLRRRLVFVRVDRGRHGWIDVLVNACPRSRLGVSGGRRVSGEAVNLMQVEGVWADLSGPSGKV